MRATVRRVNDSSALQRIQVSRLEGEVFDDCERVGQYGLSSNPPVGSEAIVVQIGASPDHHVVIGVDDGSRPKSLPAGATVLYDESGTKVYLRGDGSLQVQCSGALTISAASVAITAGSVSLSGNLAVAGNVTIGGLLNGHTP